MSLHLAFWTGALANLGLVVVFMLYGIRQVRGGDVQAHQRSMKVAGFLVLLFLVSYLVKLAVLGREDLSTWSSFYVWTLRVHELCVAVLLVGGGVAFRCGSKLRATRLVTQNPESPAASPKLLRTHRGAGRSAAVGAVLGWFLAAVVLVGMYGRA